jgi:hypothetical protein
MMSDNTTNGVQLLNEKIKGNTSGAGEDLKKDSSPFFLSFCIALLALSTLFKVAFTGTIGLTGARIRV